MKSAKFKTPFASLAAALGTPANDEPLLAQLLSRGKLQNAEETNEVAAAIRPTVVWGLIITAFVLGFFVLWAGFAPLESAAIANGSIVLHENRKTVQHLEGGIIAEILVEDGDLVKTGQPLIVLNSTSANAQQSLLLGQLHTAQATEARLKAERDDEQEIVFDPILIKNTQPEMVELIKSQRYLFETRQASVKGQIDVLQERIMQFNDQIRGLGQQNNEIAAQSALIGDEIATVTKLLERGLEQKPRLLGLQRRQSELKGEAAGHTAEIATAKSNISEAQLQIINVQNEYLKDVMTELRDVQQQVADLKEKLSASGDILERTVIAAPQAGKITGMKFHTIGGVIAPGAPLLDIVPQNDKLVVEAHIKPEDIDIVHEGLSAKVMLTAYKSRFVPRLEGIVTQLSADKFTDDKTGQAYYLARIEISEAALAKLSGKVELYPGMPAESFIKTQESTLLDYMISPILDSVRHSFREQ